MHIKFANLRICNKRDGGKFPLTVLMPALLLVFVETNVFLFLKKDMGGKYLLLDFIHLMTYILNRRLGSVYQGCREQYQPVLSQKNFQVWLDLIDVTQKTTVLTVFG